MHTFPLPPCREHTFQWEDGEHTTCYRCGAPAETPTIQETTMNAFTPGTRVDDDGRTGTVIVDTAKTAEHPGFVAVAWDDGATTLASPNRLTVFREHLPSPVTKEQAVKLAELICSLGRDEEGASPTVIYAFRGSYPVHRIVSQLMGLTTEIDREYRRSTSTH